MTSAFQRARAAHARLLDLADAEQHLCEAALSAVFHRPDLESALAGALDYPAWPAPLTVLAGRAPELVDVDPDLSAYLALARKAGDEALDLLDEYGWPPHGSAAADAAWLLAQHADHHDGRGALIALLERAVAEQRADPRHLALLTDRDRSLRGRPQRYGTFMLVRDEIPHWLYPPADPDHFDRQRTRIGLPPLHRDAAFAYSPIIAYLSGRTSDVNPPLSSPQGRPFAPPPQAIDVPATPAHPAGTGVYLAATLRRREEMHRVRDQLPQGLTSTARWLDVDPLTRPSCQFDAGIALSRFVARMCLADIARADVVLAFPRVRRSSGLDIEIGAALALGKRVVLVGAPKCSFDMLPQVTVAHDLQEALTAAGAR
jgi:hypothetical protein